MPAGKIRQNSLRTRLAIVALLFSPWYLATASSIARSRAVAENVLTLVFCTVRIPAVIYKYYIKFIRYADSLSTGHTGNVSV